MADQYRATPEQWEIVTGKFGAMVPVLVELIASCVHELRDRIAAIEQRNQTPQDFTPPLNCSQRLQKEGKPYPKSDCNVCGQMSPMWRQCAAALGRDGTANSSAEPKGSSAPAGGLVERVADVMDGGTESQARAAILAVADAMESHNFPAACWLRDEVRRNQQD
jgi:hypothetical protein